MKFPIHITLLACLSAASANADLLDALGLRKTPADTNSPALSALSHDQVASGLKEALAKGLEQAVTRLGHDGGFLTNLDVHIPMPEKLHTVERTLRSLKQDKLADDFIATMNHAAEQAVPEAAPIFTDAVKQMTIADATAILTGTNDAATTYFKNATRSNLFARFRPIVQKATGKTGATSAYKNMMGRIESKFAKTPPPAPPNSSKKSSARFDAESLFKVLSCPLRLVFDTAAVRIPFSCKIWDSARIYL